MKEITTVYFLFVNLVAICLSIADKRRAIRGRWRVPEKVLFLCALLGGTIGEYAAMLIIGHKTRHKRFMIGLPIIFVFQLILLWILGR